MITHWVSFLNCEQCQEFSLLRSIQFLQKKIHIFAKILAAVYLH